MRIPDGCPFESKRLSMVDLRSYSTYSAAGSAGRLDTSKVRLQFRQSVLLHADQPQTPCRSLKDPGTGSQSSKPAHRCRYCSKGISTIWTPLLIELRLASHLPLLSAGIVMVGFRYVTDATRNAFVQKSVSSTADSMALQQQRRKHLGHYLTVKESG